MAKIMLNGKSITMGAQHRTPIGFATVTNHKIEVGEFVLSLKEPLINHVSFSNTRISAGGTILLEWNASTKTLSLDTI